MIPSEISALIMINGIDNKMALPTLLGSLNGFHLFLINSASRSAFMFGIFFSIFINNHLILNKDIWIPILCCVNTVI